MEENVLMKMDMMGNRGGGKKAHQQQGRGCGQSLHRGQCQMRGKERSVCTGGDIEGIWVCTEDGGLNTWLGTKKLFLLRS